MSGGQTQHRQTTCGDRVGEESWIFCRHKTFQKFNEQDKIQKGRNRVIRSMSSALSIVVGFDFLVIANLETLT